MTLHISYSFLIPSSAEYDARRIAVYSVVIPLLVALIVLEYIKPFESDMMDIMTVSVIIVCCFLILSVSLISFRVTKAYNYAVDFFAMRFGILTMIIMGESMLACIIGEKSSAIIGYGSSALLDSAHASGVYYEPGGALHAVPSSSVDSSVYKSILPSPGDTVSTLEPLTTAMTDIALAPDGILTPDNVLHYLKYAKQMMTE